MESYSILDAVPPTCLFLVVVENTLSGCRHCLQWRGCGLGDMVLPADATEEHVGGRRVGKFLATHSALSDGDLTTIKGRHFAGGGGGTREGVTLGLVIPRSSPSLGWG